MICLNIYMENTTEDTTLRPDVDGKILVGSGVDWIRVAQKRAECSAVVNTKQ